jgi:EPS-associated MarR family transcriptional regulator
MDIPKQNSAAKEDLGLLAVMEAIEEKNHISQRELAKKTGLNLKKVNYCLHKLLEKGHVKFQKVRNNPDKRVYLYLLTPAGLKAKSRLTYGFLRFTLDFYIQVEDKLRSCVREMAAAGVRRVVLCGASDAARILVSICGETDDLALLGVVDDEFEGSEAFGLSVLKVVQLEDTDCDGILITALENTDSIQERLVQAGVPTETIWWFS